MGSPSLGAAVLTERPLPCRQAGGVGQAARKADNFLKNFPSDIVVGSRYYFVYLPVLILFSNAVFELLIILSARGFNEQPAVVSHQS